MTLPLSKLLVSHHAVLVANGAYKARRLSLPGFENEEVQNRTFSAQEFVGFYNGDNYFQSRYLKKKMDRFGGVIGIVGCGNVALDIARIIMCHDWAYFFVNMILDGGWPYRSKSRIAL